MLRLAVSLVLLIGPATLEAQGAAVRHDIVRGRVTADSARPVPSATVVVTRTSDLHWQSATSGADGQFRVDWPDGTGRYTVHVDAPGFTAMSVDVARRGADSVIDADVRLVRPAGAQRLAPVVTSAQRPRPSRDAAGSDAAAAEFTTIPQNAARRLAPDQTMPNARFDRNRHHCRGNSLFGRFVSKSLPSSSGPRRKPNPGRCA